MVNRGTADRVCSGMNFWSIGFGGQAPGLISRVVAWPRVLQATEIQALPSLLGLSAPSSAPTPAPTPGVASLPSLLVQPAVFDRIRFRTVAPTAHHILSLAVQSCDLDNIANAVTHADYSSCSNMMTNDICQPTCLTGYQTVTPASPIDRVRDQSQISHVEAAHATLNRTYSRLF